MKTTTGTAVLALSVFTELTDRLAGITNGMFVEPEREIRDGVDNVARGGIFPDELKRSYTLLSILADERSAASKDIKTFLESVEDEPDGLTALKKLFGETSTLAPMLKKWRGVQVLHGLMKDIFWEDVRRTYPELSGKTSIGVRKGWIACWDNARPEFEAELFGDEGVFEGILLRELAGGGGRSVGLEDILGALHRIR